MTQEEKQLLIKDLCARLPYGVKVKNVKNNFDINTFNHNVEEIKFLIEEYNIKPYLRPMSSMTDEERKRYKSFFSIGEYSCGGSLNGEEYEYINSDSDDIGQCISLIDWLNEHHFDYRNLIEKGLALEAHAGMYKEK